MNILFAVHQWLPMHAAGGEMYCVNMAAWLKKQGHHVRVLLTEAGQYGITEPYEWDGIEIFVPTRDISPLFTWCEIALSHLEVTTWCAAMCKIYRKPMTYISHNTWPYDIVIQSNEWPNNIGKNRRAPLGVIYNCHGMKGILQYANPNTVLYPAVDFNKYNYCKRGDKITLINMNANKGGKLFVALAKALPEYQFLGVGGAYEKQWGEATDNLTILGNSPDMERVYTQTRILVCPSAYESWGMCASEAMCNGIPVIYNPTFGLSENVGDAGIAVPNVNPDYQDGDLRGGEHSGIDAEANLPYWVDAIRSLDDPDTYQKYSILSEKKMRERDLTGQLQELENFLYNEITNYRYLQG